MNGEERDQGLGIRNEGMLPLAAGRENKIARDGARCAFTSDFLSGREAGSTTPHVFEPPTPCCINRIYTAYSFSNWLRLRRLSVLSEGWVVRSPRELTLFSFTDFVDKWRQTVNDTPHHMQEKKQG